MRFLTGILLFVLLCGVWPEPTVAQRNDDSEPLDRCESTDCFNQTRIRNVEVLDEASLILYVGARECPFLVELTGTFCDLTFLPGYDIIFRPSSQRQSRTVPIIGGTRGGIEQPRVCASDIHLGIEQGPFTTAGGAPEENIRGLSCTIRDVRSLTDDERLQLYVDRDLVAPPPPFGIGRVEAPEDPQEVSEQPDGEASASEEGDEPRRRRRRRDRDDD